MRSQRGQSEALPGADFRVLNGGTLNSRPTGRDGSVTGVRDEMAFPRPYGADPYVAKLARDIEQLRDPLWLRMFLWAGLGALSVCAFVGFLVIARWLGAVVWRLQ